MKKNERRTVAHAINVEKANRVGDENKHYKKTYIHTNKYTKISEPIQKVTTSTTERLNMQAHK